MNKIDICFRLALAMNDQKYILLSFVLELSQALTSVSTRHPPPQLLLSFLMSGASGFDRLFSSSFCGYKKLFFLVCYES